MCATPIISIVCQLPHSLEHCDVAMSFFACQNENKEQSDHENNIEDVGYNMFESYYDDMFDCDDNDKDVYEKRHIHDVVH